MFKQNHRSRRILFAVRIFSGIILLAWLVYAASPMIREFRSVDKTVRLENLPPLIESLASETSVKAIRKILQDSSFYHPYAHELRSAKPSRLVCNENCFEVGFSGDRVDYFAMDIGGDLFDLQSGKFLVSTDEKSKPLDIDVLLFHFILPQKIRRDQNQEIQDALRQARRYVGKDGKNERPEYLTATFWLVAALIAIMNVILPRLLKQSSSF